MNGPQSSRSAIAAQIASTSSISIAHGSPDQLRETVRSESDDAGAAAADRDFETAFVAYLHHRGH